MDKGFIIIVLPLIFMCLGRVLNSKANYYLIVKINRGEKNKVKFYSFGKIRYLLVSVFCYEREVAKTVLIYSLIITINTIFMAVTALISYYFELTYLSMVFQLLGAIILILLLIKANFNDRTVWTDFGTRK